MQEVGKMRNQDVIGKAISRFRDGYNCAETVLMTFAESYGINNDIIPRIATGFGGGIGRRGSVCGALSGAVMALGLKYGRDTMEEKERTENCTRRAFECYTRFDKEFGGVLCYDLIKCDLSTPDGYKQFRELGLRETNCTKYIEEAMKILLDLTKE